MLSTTRSQSQSFDFRPVDHRAGDCAHNHPNNPRHLTTLMLIRRPCNAIACIRRLRTYTAQDSLHMICISALSPRSPVSVPAGRRRAAASRVRRCASRRGSRTVLVRRRTSGHAHSAAQSAAHTGPDRVIQDPGPARTASTAAKGIRLGSASAKVVLESRTCWLGRTARGVAVHTRWSGRNARAGIASRTCSSERRD